MNNITNIIKENKELIYKIINKYRNFLEIEDLYQVAVLGLIKASKNYRNTYNTKFISYAYPYILGEVIKYVNEYRGIKISKNSKILYNKINKASQILSQKLMKNPTSYELSLFLEIDEKIIDEVLIANSTIDSLDKLLTEDGKNFELYDTIGYYYRGLAVVTKQNTAYLIDSHGKTIDGITFSYDKMVTSYGEAREKSRCYDPLMMNEDALIVPIDGKVAVVHVLRNNM